MKKHFYFCILFCLAVAAYPQELPRVGENEAVQNETVNETVMSMRLLWRKPRWRL